MYDRNLRIFFFHCKICSTLFPCFLYFKRSILNNFTHLFFVFETFINPFLTCLFTQLPFMFPLSLSLSHSPFCSITCRFYLLLCRFSFSKYNWNLRLYYFYVIHLTIRTYVILLLYIYSHSNVPYAVNIHQQYYTQAQFIFYPLYNAHKSIFLPSYRNLLGKIHEWKDDEEEKGKEIERKRFFIFYMKCFECTIFECEVNQKICNINLSFIILHSDISLLLQYRVNCQ